MEDAAPLDPAACFTALMALVKSMLGARVRPRDAALAAEARALWGYLSRQSRRFATLAARIQAGTLAPLPFRQRAAPIPSPETDAPESPGEPQ